ncbi:hypothetical protein [Apibacter mensalis]|uniref:hypothetical protein n=1 Tax=Apibacter mensalis TaxID=1586267 RepID=UPI0026F33C08|nr:hypothetical protein [Apibacter mensalis]
MRSIIINPYNKEEIKVIQHWIEGNRFPKEAINWLSTKMLVVYKGELPIYRIFIYDTNSAICWIGWELANPEATKEQKKGGLDFLIKEVCNYAKYNGYSTVFTTSQNPAIIAKLLENQFQKGDSKVNHYIKNI